MPEYKQLMNPAAVTVTQLQPQRYRLFLKATWKTFGSGQYKLLINGRLLSAPNVPQQ